MSVEYRGEKFSGYNKPKRTPKHPTKSHVVLVKCGGKDKMIRFGEQGAKLPVDQDEVSRKQTERSGHRSRLAIARTSQRASALRPTGPTR